MVSRQPIDYFEAGMDLHLSQDILESYRIFQGRVQAQYSQMIDQYGFEIVNAAEEINIQQTALRSHIRERIRLSDFIERKNL